tara:strand:- start:987 stop:2222 length:1236 start_codon:yes stop_codon:yes gene_type:complete
MSIEIIVPTLGESVTEATVAKWFKTEGEAVVQDEPIVELETDKVTLEVPASVSGTLTEVRVEEGTNVEVGFVLGLIVDAPVAVSKDSLQEETSPKITEKIEEVSVSGKGENKNSPAVRKLINEHSLDVSKITGSGKDGRLTKGDVLSYLDNLEENLAGAEEIKTNQKEQPIHSSQDVHSPREERVQMTRLRKRIAERLKQAQNTAAMLTTFNEIDMTNVMGARENFKEKFQQKHGVRLGFMAFFVKAVVVALREIPSVNAQIDGDELVYKNYYDIGVAVGTEQGLVVPVVRKVDEKSFAEIERDITELGARAREGKLGIDELTGGTFTITNGGVYGSLMSTPILNPPQSGILGMHKIDRRPVAIGENIEIRPVMNVALTYDHRIIDGREAVTFLVRVKECIENPERILLSV